jgi:hypothetical protein
MKRLAPILLLGLVACNSTSHDPVNPAPVRMSRLASAPRGAEVQSTDFCKGGNAWWNIKFDIFDDVSFDQCEVRVYTVDKQNVRHFFALAKTGVPELEGTHFNFYAEAMAPADSMRDYIDAGYDPNFGFAMFSFDVYNTAHHEVIGSTMQGSDVPMTSNLFPHPCPNIKPQTGCGFLCCPENNAASASQTDGVWSWQISGNFLTGPCANSTLRLKAFFVDPSGKSSVFARGEATETDPYGDHEFTLAGVAPKLDASSLPPDWVPTFVIVVTSNGTPAGQFQFVAPNALTPNTK